MTQVSSRLQFSETFAYNPSLGVKRKPVWHIHMEKSYQKQQKSRIQKNKIVIKKNTVTGTGDFTVYTGGKTEEGKNTQEKGDCATKGEIDNPNTGKKIKLPIK